jgi:hypothetical protein
MDEITIRVKKKHKTFPLRDKEIIWWDDVNFPWLRDSHGRDSEWSFLYKNLIKVPTKHTSFNDQDENGAVNWLNANCNSYWATNYVWDEIIFFDEKDAILFKLTF